MPFPKQKDISDVLRSTLAGGLPATLYIQFYPRFSIQMVPDPVILQKTGFFIPHLLFLLSRNPLYRRL